MIEKILKNKVKISIVLSIALLLIIIVVAVINKLESDRLNPGGTGGGYVPSGYVTISGIDDSFRLSDSHHVTIRVGLETIFKSKIPNEPEYKTVTSKKSLDALISPSNYQYTSFDITVNDKYNYNVVFTIDYISNWRKVYVESDGVIELDGINTRGLKPILKKGIPSNIIDGIISNLKREFPGIKSVKFSDGRLKVNKSGSRSLSLILYIGNASIDTEISYYNRDSSDNFMTLRKSDGISKKYTFNHYHD